MFIRLRNLDCELMVLRTRMGIAASKVGSNLRYAEHKAAVKIDKQKQKRKAKKEQKIEVVETLDDSTKTETVVDTSNDTTKSTAKIDGEVIEVEIIKPGEKVIYGPDFSNVPIVEDIEPIPAKEEKKKSEDDLKEVTQDHLDEVFANEKNDAKKKK